MKKLLIALAVAGCAAMGANAATVSYAFNLPVTETVAELDSNNSLNYFDSTLGTLTGANLELFGAMTFTYGAKNTSGTTQSARMTISSDMSFVTDLAALTPLWIDNYSFALATGLLSYTSGQTRNFGPTNQSQNQNIDLNSILSSLQAPGAFNINCSTLSGLTVAGGGGNITGTQTTTGGCGARITYNYTAAPVIDPPIDVPPTNNVPEPGSLALMGLALAGVGMVRRKKK